MKRLISALLSLILILTSFNMTMFTAYGADSALSQAYGWYESIHIEWTNDSNAAGASVYYKHSTDNKYTSIDAELIRQNGTGGVADIVGISSGIYDIKVTTSSGKTLTKDRISVARHDRSGYGHFGLSGGLGGYNNDGTPKSNAQIVYVNNSNKNTVKLGSYTGISNILKKGSSSAPLIVRIIGTVDTQTRDADGTKTTDKNNGVVAINGLTDNVLSEDSYFNMLDVSGMSNITVEGIGTDAVIEKWGFTFSKCNSIEVRNLTFTKYPEDACSFEGSSSSNSKYKNYWVHNNYFKMGENKYDLTAEQDKHEGDGSSDFKGCRNITYSYNVFEKCHKTSLHGGGDSSLQYNSTWHHNYFNASSSRLPLTRQVNLHSYNNYFYKGSKCIDARASAWVLAECNYFDNSTGILTTANSTYGDPIVKSLNNVFANGSGTSDKAKTIKTTTDRTLTISASTGSNASKNPYPNFDTNPSLFYYDSSKNCSDVEYLTDANTAKADALKSAGKVKADAVLSAYAPSAEDITETTTSAAIVSGDSERFDKMEMLINKMMEEDGPENGSLWNKENTSAFKWSYINGCMVSGMLQLYEAKQDESYKTFADNYMSPFIGTSSTSTKGYIADNNFKISNYTLDDLNSGKALIELIALGSKNSVKYTNAVSDTLIGKSLNYQLNNQVTAEGNLWHKKSYPYQVWLDGIYMETPFWLEYELEIGNDKNSFMKAADHTTKQIQNVYNKLRDPATGLYYHGYDSRADKSSGDYGSSASSWASKTNACSANFWLRGTGWYAMALVDNIELMQKAEKKFNIDLSSHKNTLINIYTDLMNSMLKYQDSNTKLWYQVINHPKNDNYNYIETSGSAAISYALMKGYNIGVADYSFYEKGLEVFRGICDNKLLYTSSSKTSVDLNDICQTAGLGGSSKSATIGPKHTSRDGSYEYYVSEKTVTNDAKGVGPLIFAYCQILKHNNGNEPVTETTTQVTTKAETTTQTTTKTEPDTEVTTAYDSHVGENIGGGSGESNRLVATDFAKGTKNSNESTANGIFTINANSSKTVNVSSDYIDLSGGGNTSQRSIAVKVSGKATLTVKFFNTGKNSRTLAVENSDGSYSKTGEATTGGSVSKLNTLTCDITSADTYYVFSKGSGIKVTEITVTYPSGGDSILIGDVDLNGKINSADAALLLKHISGIVTLTNDKQLTAGDCDMDGKQDILDVIAILKYKG